jgi:hypothetical protein
VDGVRVIAIPGQATTGGEWQLWVVGCSPGIQFSLWVVCANASSRHHLDTFS